MIRGLIIATFVAMLVHAGILLFGGALKFLMVKHVEKPKEEVVEVDLSEDVKKDDDKDKEVKKVEKVEEAPEEQMPDSTVLEEMEQPQAPAALAAVSLDALSSALTGVGGGDFGSGTSFSSGGVVGGLGAPGSGGSISDIMGGGGSSTRPQVLNSVKPKFTPALQRKGGSITLVIFVTANGKVNKVEVEKSSEASMEQPAIEAVRAWTFEPATRGGKKVPAKIRQTIKIDPPIS